MEHGSIAVRSSAHAARRLGPPILVMVGSAAQPPRTLGAEAGPLEATSPSVPARRATGSERSPRPGSSTERPLAPRLVSASGRAMGLTLNYGPVLGAGLLLQFAMHDAMNCAMRAWRHGRIRGPAVRRSTFRSHTPTCAVPNRGTLRLALYRLVSKYQQTAKKMAPTTAPPELVEGSECSRSSRLARRSCRYRKSVVTVTPSSTPPISATPSSFHLSGAGLVAQ